MSTEKESKLQKFIIANVKPRMPEYSYENEQAMNPAYQNVEDIRCPLKRNEKRIWVLRGDLVIATGIKNTYSEIETITSLQSKISRRNYKFINWNDRYGHPSLAMPENGYDGSVYYAGHIAQKDDHLLVYLSSGRFSRDDLDVFQRTCLEIYIAQQLISTYGKQDIIFVDSDGIDELTGVFLQDYESFLHPRRHYSEEFISKFTQFEQDNDEKDLQVCVNRFGNEMLINAAEHYAVNTKNEKQLMKLLTDEHCGEREFNKILNSVVLSTLSGKCLILLLKVAKKKVWNPSLVSMVENKIISLLENDEDGKLAIVLNAVKLVLGVNVVGYIAVNLVTMKKQDELTRLLADNSFGYKEFSVLFDVVLGGTLSGASLRRLLLAANIRKWEPSLVTIVRGKLERLVKNDPKNRLDIALTVVEEVLGEQAMGKLKDIKKEIHKKIKSIHTPFVLNLGGSNKTGIINQRSDDIGGYIWKF